MIRKYVFFISFMFGVMAFLLSAMPALANPKINDVRFGVYEEKTRLVFDLSEGIPFQLFMLPDPYRVVIDMPVVDWKLPPGSGTKGRGLIQGYRYGLFDKDTFRIVIDTKGPVVASKAFTLPKNKNKPPRLVIDFKTVSRQAFLDKSRKSLSRVKIDREVETVEKPPIADRAPRDKPVIVIDAGHGGVDPGAIGRKGTYEKTITLRAAKLLKSALEKTNRYKVILTRNRDIFLKLRERMNVARRAEADLFISLHADSNPNAAVRGASIYTLSETASDKEAARLARRENKADLIAGVDLSDEQPIVTSILLDLAQRETMNMSAKYASLVVGDLANHTKLLRNTHRFAGFVVLKAPDVPSVLVELGYLSNTKDEKLLKKKTHLSKLVEGIVRATNQYFRWRDGLQRS